MADASKQQLDRELEMFGCSVEDMRTGVTTSLFTTCPSPEDLSKGYGLLAMSILSDAQEHVRMGNDELARWYMNRAKWVISTYWIGGGAL